MATKIQRSQATQSLMKAMAHPLRAEAFRLIRDKHPISTSEIARLLDTDAKELSYHIRMLRKYDCVEQVSTRRVRAVLETFYRPTELHIMIDTDEWQDLVEAEPEMSEFIVDDIVQSLLDDYTDSRRSSVVGVDEEFFIVRNLPVLDAEGVQEALEASQRYEDEIHDIAARSVERQGETGEANIPTSSSIIFFKTPKASDEQNS
jgi:DNA-binding transcriptional ArsR family regulator